MKKMLIIAPIILLGCVSDGRILTKSEAMKSIEKEMLVLNPDMEIYDDNNSRFKDGTLIDNDGNKISGIRKINNGTKYKYIGMATYKNGEANGLLKLYELPINSVEFPICDITVKNGKYNGESKCYIGERLYTLHNYKDGMKHGIAETYYTSGKIRTESIYKNDEVSQTMYHSNDGSIQMLVSFENDKAISGVCGWKSRRWGRELTQAEIETFNKDKANVIFKDLDCHIIN